MTCRYRFRWQGLTSAVPKRTSAYYSGSTITYSNVTTPYGEPPIVNLCEMGVDVNHRLLPLSAPLHTHARQGSISEIRGPPSREPPHFGQLFTFCPKEPV